MRNLASHVGIGRSGGSRVILIHLAIVAVFGVYLPWRKGLEFLDPVLLAAYACLGVLFAAPAAIQAFAGERPSTMKDAMTRVVMAVLYGEGMAVVILLAGFLTVYLTRPAMFAPDLGTLAAASILAIVASLALAALSAWLTLRFSASAARRALRVIFLLLLVVFYFRARWLPDVADTATLVFLVLAAVAIFALRGVLKARSE